jgi:CHAD domain-containing protein
MAACAFTRSQSLDPVARLRTDRTEFMINVGGGPALKVCDDIVTVDRTREPVAPFREIELELASGDVDPKLLKVVTSTLRAAGCRTEDPLPKAIRALGPRARLRPDVVADRSRKQATTEELLRHVVARSVVQLIDHHAAVWVGDDPEDLHVFRVAARRLRSDLRTFSPLLDEKWTSWAREELAWLGAEVGRGRDADVLAERLRSQMKQLPGEDAQSVDRLLSRLAENSSEGRRHVLAALSADRYVTLLESLVDAAHQPRLAGCPADLGAQPARRVVLKLVRKPWRRLRGAAKSLNGDSPDSAFHAVRILSKRARYAAEAVAPLYGRVARRFAEAVADVQSVLGEHQDTVVAEQWLREAAKAVPPSRLVIGELLAIERMDRVRLRKEFKTVWKKASRRSLRTWLH